MNTKLSFLTILLSIPFILEARQMEFDIFLDNNVELQNKKNFVNKIEYFEKIICGNRHCYGLKDGKLYSGGYNNYGQLGIGTETIDFQNWLQIDYIDNVKQIEAYKNYGMLVTEDGKIYSVGNSKEGMIGLPEEKHYSKFTKINVKNLNSSNIVIIMSERTTFLKDVENEKYFATGTSFNKKGAFAWFDTRSQMEFVEIELGDISTEVFRSSVSIFGR